MTALKCFVIMPFGDRFDPVFGAVKRACSDALPGETIDCYWLKDIHAAGKISDDIVNGLQEAALCIADVTGSSPNVMWETGYAMALGKPTILIGQRVQELPFDLLVHRVLPYTAEALDDMVSRLAKGVRETLAKYELQSPSRSYKPLPHPTRCIVVTGSSRADPARVRRRIEALLQPYIGSDTTWYCGSTGTVDEAVIDYLVSAGERAVAVAYHRYDFSEGVRRLVETDKVPFIDASVESLPKGLKGPSDRDVFFCTKADLIILLWDGHSLGTDKLIQYFCANARPLLIGFV